MSDIKFKNLELSDKIWIDKYLRQEDIRNVDFSFTNMFMYRNVTKRQVAETDGCFVSKMCFSGKIMYSFPVGTGDKSSALFALRKDAKDHHFGRFAFIGVLKEQTKLLDAVFPDGFRFIYDRENSDYVYLTEKLATLSGKKFHSKKNFINRFIKENPDWKFEELSENNLDECLGFSMKWFEKYVGEDDILAASEQAAMKDAFDHFGELGLTGGILRVGGRMVSFTAGDVLCSDTFDIHFEKGIREMPGSFAMINWAFANHILKTNPEIIYIDREEDMGYENLRKAKESYHPVFLVDKYVAINK